MKNTQTHKWKSGILASVFGFTLVTPALASEVQIFSNEQREENANLLILDFDDTGGNVTLQFGNSLGETLYWDDANGQFVFTDDLNVQGNIDVDGTITAGSDSHQLTNATGLIDGDKVQDDTIDDDSIDFGMGVDQVGADDITADPTSIGASNQNNVQGILEDLDNAIGATSGSTGTESNIFTLDNDDTGGNVTLRFGDTLGEQLSWDDTAGQFVFTDDVDIAGNITLTGTVDGVDVSGLETTVGTIDGTVDGHLDGGANKHDTSEIDVESTTAANFAAGDLETALGSVDSNIGDRTYTNDNVVTDGESTTASIDALDTEVGNLNTDVSNINTDISNIGTDVGDLDHTGQTYLTTGDDVTTSLENLDAAVDGNDTDITNLGNDIGNQTYTNDNIVTDGESVTSSLDAIDTAVGDRTYTNDNVLTDGQSVTESLDAVDSALEGIGQKALFVTMNDLTVQEDGVDNQANLYNDSETGTNPHQFYLLKSRKPTLQDLTLQFKVRLPEDFVDFSTTGDLSFFYKNTGADATDSAIDISIADKDGDVAFTPATGLFNTAWTEYTSEFTGADFNPVAGDYIYVTIKAYGSYDGDYQSPYMGELLVKYNSNDL